jgi:hypothetical protein
MVTVREGSVGGVKMADMGARTVATVVTIRLALCRWIGILMLATWQGWRLCLLRLLRLLCRWLYRRLLVRRVRGHCPEDSLLLALVLALVWVLRLRWRGPPALVAGKREAVILLCRNSGLHELNTSCKTLREIVNHIVIGRITIGRCNLLLRLSLMYPLHFLSGFGLCLPLGCSIRTPCLLWSSTEGCTFHLLSTWLCALSQIS